MTRLLLVTVAAATGALLWERRDREQFEALVAVIRKQPLLYRVTLNSEPMVRMHGDHGRIVSSTINAGRIGVHVAGQPWG